MKYDWRYIFIFVIHVEPYFIRHEETASIKHFTFSIKFEALWVMAEPRGNRYVSRMPVNETKVCREEIQK